MTLSVLDTEEATVIRATNKVFNVSKSGLGSAKSTKLWVRLVAFSTMVLTFLIYSSAVKIQIPIQQVSE